MEREQLVSLVTAAQSGDGVALNDLFNAFYNDVYYFALKTVKDDQIACDVTQETFVEIINTLGKLQEPAAFVTWMKQITYHQCTRYFKKKKDVIVDEDEDGNTVFDTLQEEKAEFIPDEALDKEDFRKTVMTFVDELSEEQRAAVMMFYFDEMSVKDIAETQNVSENTVKSRLNYARKGIKKSVEDYEKKTGVKLYGLGVLPLLVWLFKGVFAETMSPAAASAVASGVSAATGTAVSVGVSASAAAATATAATATATAATGAAGGATAASAATAVGMGAKIAAIPLVTKIIAGVTAAAIVGGTTTAVVLTQSDDEPADGSGSNQTVTGEEIPEGMTYTLSDGTVLEAGDNFPANCTAGDRVDYGDYYYGYECFYVKNLPDSDDLSGEWMMSEDYYVTRDDGGQYIPADSGVTETDIFGCWLPMVKDTGKTAYGELLTEINGKHIGALHATFMGCEKMTKAPAVPETVTAMSMTFYGCKALETAPVIPRSVRRLMGVFRDCEALSGDIVYNGKLDGGASWFSADMFLNVRGEINLKGEAIHEDLANMAMYAQKQGITIRLRGALFASDEEFEPLGEGEHIHDFETTVTKKATCMAKGEKQHRCKICDTVYIDVLSRTSHKYEGAEPIVMVNRPTPPLRNCTVCGKQEAAPEDNEWAILDHSFGDYSLGLIFQNAHYFVTEASEFPVGYNVYTAADIWAHMNITLARDAHSYETEISSKDFFAEANKYFVLTDELKQDFKELPFYNAANDSFTYVYDGEAHGAYGAEGYIHNGGNNYTVYYSYAQGISDDDPMSYYKIELEYNRTVGGTVPNRYLSIEVVESLPQGLLRK